MSGSRCCSRILSIDEIYSKVKDYDLVITNDIALCTALNRRVDRTSLDTFCMTPRQIALRFFPSSYGRRPADDIELIDMISRDTGITDLRYIHGEILAIRDILRHTSDLYRGITTVRGRKVVDSFRKCPVLENYMCGFPANDFPFFKGKHICVIGNDDPEILFDNMDRNLFSQSMDVIHIRTSDDYSIDTIYEVGNDRQLAENAVDLIEKDKAESYAIVLAPDSPVLDSVRSELYRRDIPFVNKVETRQLAKVRDFLRFIELALDYEVLRVRSVSETITSFGGRIFDGNDNYLFSKIPGAYSQYGAAMDERADDLRNVMRDIRTFTFGALMEILFPDRPDPSLERVLKRSRMMGSTISRPSYGNLLYLIDNVDLGQEDTPDDERHGVLIADCSNSAFIDRSVIIYLGMGQDWNLDIAGKKYLDPQDELDREAFRLSVLMQQGSVRFHLVNSSKNGKDAVPCSTFAKVFGLPGAPKSFRDILPEGKEPVKGMWAEGTHSGGLERDDSLRDRILPYDRDFSATSFNDYAFCPKRFMFGRLIGTTDKDVMMFGNLIHDFAELCATHREVVREKGVKHFAEKVNEIYSGISSPVLKELDSCRMVLQMDNILRFMDGMDVRVPLDRPVSKGQNPLMDSLEIRESSSRCESQHYSSDRPMEGRFDLIWDGCVYDYKTGKRMRTPDDVVKGFEIGKKLKRNQHYDCQGLFYLYLASEDSDDGPAKEFDLFFPMANDTVCMEKDYDIADSILRIRIMPGTSDDYIRGRVEDAQVDAGGMMFDDPMYYKLEDAVVEAQGNVTRKDWKNNKDLRGSVIKKLGVFKDDAVKVYIDLKCSEESSPYFVNSKVVDIPRQSLESFVSTVAIMHSRMIEQSCGSFPCDPMGECRDCDFRSLCTGSIVQVESGGDSDE